MLPLLLAAALMPRPASAAELPPSGIRVVVSSAAVTQYECRRRAFAWEDTQGVGSWMRSATRGMRAGGDLPSVIQGGLATLIMAPMYVLAVPADLVSAPFRRTCTFQVELAGKLSEWAGMAPTGAVSLEAEGMNLLADEVPGVRKPKWAVSKASTTTDAQGVYALSLPGQVGAVSSLAIAWRIKGEPGGQLLLEKKGGVFVLSEPDPGFGVGASDMEDMTIEPVRKPRPPVNP